MATKIAFNSDDKIVDQNACVEQINVKDLEKYFDVDKIVQYILQGKYSVIALQFPDELMTYSTSIASELKSKTEAQIFVLADTSYGSCCVDEVAASHYNADLIIHFGQSCLSNTGKIAVYYSFGKELIDIDVLLSKLGERFTPDDKILVLYDVQYDYPINSNLDVVKKNFQNASISCLNLCNSSEIADNVTIKFGRVYTLTHSIEEYTLVFIGSNERTLYNTIVSYPRNTVYSYDVKLEKLQKEDLNVNKYLMRRFYLIEKAKDAQIVGIVMGTLGVARYNDMVNRLKSILKQSGKKFYTFIIGKINPAKLANFMEIDMFVLVACPENSLLDSKEFYKPIITPYEMEMACLSGRSWSGDVVTDFRELLSGSKRFVELDGENDGKDKKPEYSLITGKLRNNNTMSEPLCTDVATRNESNSLVASSARNASEYLASRTWQGLQIDSGKTEVKLAVEGRSGIAMNYKNEKE
ncbi:2-(3-amino-3-carboxypropyl)histidine synthase subunit 2-like [Clytia hemisphaerica]